MAWWIMHQIPRYHTDQQVTNHNLIPVSLQPGRYPPILLVDSQSETYALRLAESAVRPCTPIYRQPKKRRQRVEDEEWCM